MFTIMKTESEHMKQEISELNIKVKQLESIGLQLKNYRTRKGTT